MTVRLRMLPAAWQAVRQWLTARPGPETPRRRAGARLPTGDALYRPLYDYLSARHADRVTLTFAEVESLIDAGLPSEARLDAAWWTAADAVAADACAAADRCVTVNLKSQVVTYDRIEPARPAGRR